MIIDGKDTIKADKYLTVDDLNYIDVFVFIDNPKQICMRVEDGFYDLETGEYFDNYDYENIPIKKLKCKLVIEEN